MAKDEKPSKSPQEKKTLSYAYDRRNGYGENDKSSRKAIPARKAAESRNSRRKAAQAIKEAVIADELTVDIVESSLRHDIERVGGWKKEPDMPLRDFLQLQTRLRSGREPKA